MSEKAYASLIINIDLGNKFIDSPFEEHFVHNGFQCVISDLFSPVLRFTDCADHFMFLFFFDGEKSNESKALFILVYQEGKSGCSDSDDKSVIQPDLY